MPISRVAFYGVNLSNSERLKMYNNYMIEIVKKKHISLKKIVIFSLIFLLKFILIKM